MHNEDIIRIKHMLDAACEASQFTGERSRDSFGQDRMLMLAIVKELEIIGEAAAKISMATQNLHPDIPWQDIIGMRHRLVHAYFDIDEEVVWKTIKEDIPQLMILLTKALNK